MIGCYESMKLVLPHVTAKNRLHITFVQSFNAS